MTDRTSSSVTELTGPSLPELNWYICMAVAASQFHRWPTTPEQVMVPLPSIPFRGLHLTTTYRKRRADSSKPIFGARECGTGKINCPSHLFGAVTVLDKHQTDQPEFANTIQRFTTNHQDGLALLTRVEC